MVELVGGGSVINGAYPVKFEYRHPLVYFHFQVGDCTVQVQGSEGQWDLDTLEQHLCTHGYRGK